MFALVDNPQEKRLVCRIKDVSIRDRVLDYFKTNATGTNLQISQALGYVIASSVSTATACMVLEGELVVDAEKVHPKNGKPYKIFKLGKGSRSNNGR